MTTDPAVTAAAEDADLLYAAWAVIANVSEGDWAQQPPEWRDAAVRWRDRWHARIARGTE